MAQLVVIPDIEALAVAALNAAFADLMPGVVWATRVPDPRPARFGRIIRAGGAQETVVSDQAQLLVEGWAEAEGDAERICALGRAVLLAQDGRLFGGFTIAAPANLPDPRTSQTRYTCNVGIRARGDVVDA
jgi:hypothetical protein